MIAPVRAYDRFHLLQHLGVLPVRVDVHREDRPEVLGDEHLVARVGALDDRRPHEVAHGVVIGAAGDDVEAARRVGPVDGRLVLGEGPVVDDGTHEVRQVGDVAHRQAVGARRESFLMTFHTERGT